MTVNSSPLFTKEASLEEVNMLIRWAAAEGWNPGVDDAALFHAADSSGFFVTCVDDKPVAGISLVKHSDDQAFLGLYLCLPEYRGTGIGLATWDHALASVSGHCVGLDGVVEQQDNYRQSGFTYHFGNTRYSGPLRPSLFDNAAVMATPSTAEIRPATLDDYQSIIKYDAMIGGFERRAFINAWLTPCDTRQTFLALEDDTIVGMVGIRKCIEGFKIGPLLGNTPLIALALLASITEVASGENIMLDVPDKNPAAIEIAKSLELEPIFETTRMYRGAAPAIDLERLFGVATLELG